MKMMIFKNALLATCLLFFGTGYSQETEIMPPPPVPIVIEPGGSVDDIVDFPDVEAEFPGGTDAMRKFIQDNVQYPVDAMEKNVQGLVYIQFIVEPDGSISGIDVMRGGVSPSINREAVRLIKEMPLWTPAEVKEKKVRVRCRLPITFTL